jgi:MFS family permease
LRNFTAPTVASFLSGAAYMGGFILAPLLLRFEFGYSLSAVALIMVLRPLSYSLASPLGGQMATRIGERTTGVLGTAVLSAGLLLLAAGAAGHELGAVAVGLFLQGIGNGVSRPPLTSTLMNAVDRADLGIAAASQRMVFQIGGSFGIAAMTVVYAGRNAAGPFARAFAVGALIGLAGTVAATFVRSEDRRTDATEVAEARLVETS